MIRSHRDTNGRRRAGAAALALTVALALTGCSSDASSDADATFSDAAPSEGEISAATESLSSALRDEGLSSIATAIETVGFEQIVDSEEFTFFAPSDAAFQSMSPDDLADLLSNPTQLRDVLRNHVVTTKVSSDDVAALASIATEAGNDLEIAIAGDTLTIAGATVSATDIAVDQGTVHVVEQIFLP